MRIFVYMRDARTVYRLDRRRDLNSLVGQEPGHESKAVVAQRGTFNPHTGLYLWHRIPLRYLSKGSIAAVEEAEGAEFPNQPVEAAA